MTPEIFIARLSIVDDPQNQTKGIGFLEHNVPFVGAFVFGSFKDKEKWTVNKIHIQVLYDQLFLHVQGISQKH